MFYTTTFLLTIQVLCFNVVLAVVARNILNYANEKSNNIVNKSFWFRKAKGQTDERIPLSYMFRSNSIDVDNAMQGEFESYADGNVPNTPFITSYVERNKRSIEKTLEQLSRFKKNATPNDNSSPSMVKSKFLSKLKPASVFNDYPYEIAILLGNNKNALEKTKNYSAYVINKMIKSEQNLSLQPLYDMKNKDINVDGNIGSNNANNTVNKRRMSHHETQISNNIDLFDSILNKTGDITEGNGHSDRESKRWTSQEPYRAKYSAVENNDEQSSSRPVSEKGLIKVLSMLTNTFKKIIKQHNDIKEIHAKLHTINENFMKNIEIVSEKFQDFDSKYNILLDANKKIAEIEERMNGKEKHFASREKEFSKNLIEFEVQQKKFLTQQRQFYDIQKLMLVQNEKINVKQIAIAKMQSEISHRQNNFARILKKAKQVYLDNKSDPKASTSKFVKVEKPFKLDFNVTTSPASVNQVKNVDAPESIKINLFSIPTVQKLENQDHLLLNEKDDNSVDDLVYKYYFNNTFIDSLMRNFLSSFINFGDNNDSAHSVKTKRGEVPATTLLQAVKNITNDDGLPGEPVNRERRWINHHARKKLHHHKQKKITREKFDLDDKKPTKESQKTIKKFQEVTTTTILPNKDNNSKITVNIHKNKAFIEMARQFCHGIGQNSTSQILDWCVEKALRRLQNIAITVPPPTLNETTKESSETPNHNAIPTIPNSDAIEDFSTQSSISTVDPSNDSEITITTLDYNTPLRNYFTQSTPNFSDMFFPDLTPGHDCTMTMTAKPSAFGRQSKPILGTPDEDGISLTLTSPYNDKLESNLRQYELIPDKEGNVYYDGSAHASDMIKGHNDDSESDFLPGMDSNSRIDINTENFHTQAVRRALLSRMKYESIAKKSSKL